MKWILTLCFFCGIAAIFAQNKIEKPTTYRNVCFYAIDREGFTSYMEAQQAVTERDYKRLYPLIQKMKRSLKEFEKQELNHAFEFWYSVNYTEFEQQLEVARSSTLSALELYEERLRNAEAKYFDHRSFLNSYLAFTSEAFYPNFWFMSMERYFSQGLMQRIIADNKEGTDLFDYTDFYKPFKDFDAMLIAEEAEMKRYLGIENSDTSGIASRPLIPYSFGFIDKMTAGYVLDNFKFNDATQDLETDREVRYLKRFLLKARAETIWLVARFDGIPFGKS